MSRGNESAISTPVHPPVAVAPGRAGVLSTDDDDDNVGAPDAAAAADVDDEEAAEAEEEDACRPRGVTLTGTTSTSSTPSPSRSRPTPRLLPALPPLSFPTPPSFTAAPPVPVTSERGFESGLGATPTLLSIASSSSFVGSAASMTASSTSEGLCSMVSASERNRAVEGAGP